MDLELFISVRRDGRELVFATFTLSQLHDCGLSCDSLVSLYCLLYVKATVTIGKLEDYVE